MPTSPAPRSAASARLIPKPGRLPKANAVTAPMPVHFSTVRRVFGALSGAHPASDLPDPLVIFSSPNGDPLKPRYGAPMTMVSENRWSTHVYFWVGVERTWLPVNHALAEQ